MRQMLFLLCLALVIGATASSTPAFAVEGEVSACITSYEQGQVARDEGRLVQARDHFVACAADTCPAALRRDCRPWLSQIDTRLPTLVFHARQGDRDASDLQVVVDDVQIIDKLDGRAVAVNPGRRLIRWVQAGVTVAQDELLVVEGEKTRLVSLDLPAAEPVGVMAPALLSPPPPPPSSAGTRLAPWLTGATAVAGLGAFTLIGLGVRADVAQMEKTCAPACTDERVQSVQRRAWLANGALGVGLVAAAATWLLWPSPRREGASAQARWTLALVPTLQGGIGVVAGCH